MTIQECAAEARVSHWTIRRKIEGDEIPAYRLGRGLRVKRAGR
jgi:excisionase family DNA binding protein